MTPDRGFRLDGKHALVTGGGTGIGRGIAEAFAAAGARVAIAGRRAAVLERAAADIGAGTIALPGDVTSAEDRRRVLDGVLAELGALDVLVNCAGAVRVGALEELDDESWERMLRVNLTAAVALCRAALPHLRARRGSILNVSTGASLQPVPGHAAYGASKAALNYASQVLAMEAAPDVRVNVVCPGGVDTPLLETFVPKGEVPAVLERFRSMTPMGRVGTPADVAGAALYLASDAASWVTGVVLTVDGGMNLG
jgi:NAD(P)-dependent dehydrogenase (short-subunit alcohol dehydrogenase family)